jgi:hypothetical protein
MEIRPGYIIIGINLVLLASYHVLFHMRSVVTTHTSAHSHSF